MLAALVLVLVCQTPPPCDADPAYVARVARSPAERALCRRLAAPHSGVNPHVRACEPAGGGLARFAEPRTCPAPRVPAGVPSPVGGLGWSAAPGEDLVAKVRWRALGR
jgi:hypothetical protein